AGTQTRSGGGRGVGTRITSKSATRREIRRRNLGRALVRPALMARDGPVQEVNFRLRKVYPSPIVHPLSVWGSEGGWARDLWNANLKERFNPAMFVFRNQVLEP